MNQPLGKNSVSGIAFEIAKMLELPNPDLYTFHSFRRTSATNAADNGATPQQMVDFYGWKLTNMAKEYVSTSKHAIKTMACKLECHEKTETVESPPSEMDSKAVSNKLVLSDVLDMTKFPNVTKLVVVQNVNQLNL